MSFLYVMGHFYPRLPPQVAESLTFTKGCTILSTPAPGEVRDATEGYRSEMDVLGQFIGECCITGSDHYRAHAGELYERFKTWSGGDDAMKQNAFGTAIAERGYERTRGHGGGASVRWNRSGGPECVTG
jgi:hypothetical protein